MFKKLNSFLDDKSINIFYIFLFIQPVLDLAISFLHHNNMSSLVVFVLKMMFLIYMVYYLFFIKKKSIKYLLILFGYCAMFLLVNVFTKGYGNILYEMEALIKSIYFPVILLYGIEIFKNDSFNVKNLYKIIIIYVLLIFIPDILNIGFESYIYDKVGSVGFFFSANAVGSIISILSPLLIGYFVQNKKFFKLTIFLGIYFYVLLMIGTKAPILTTLIILLYYVVLCILRIIKKKKYVYLIILFLLFIAFLFAAIKVFPSTAFYQNMVIHAKNMEVNNFKDLLTFKKLDDYIFSGRLIMFKKSFDIYISSSIFSKLFGIGYIINDAVIKTSEMDYLVTFIHHGIIGFIIIYFVYIKMLISIIKKYFMKFKDNFINIEKSSIMLSIIISILSALLVGHVLDVPSVSIFVSSVLIYGYYKK